MPGGEGPVMDVRIGRIMVGTEERVVPLRHENSCNGKVACHENVRISHFCIANGRILTYPLSKNKPAGVGCGQRHCLVETISPVNTLSRYCYRTTFRAADVEAV